MASSTKYEITFTEGTTRIVEAEGMSEWAGFIVFDGKVFINQSEIASMEVMGETDDA